MNKIAIVQSNYIPWKGYFDLINVVDYFVLYDDVQYTRRDWRNRNKIKTASGLKWLTIPVESKNHYLSKINEITIADDSWPSSHWNTIVHHYVKAPFFQQYRELFEDLYLNCQERHLSQINYRFIKAINEMMGLKTQILRSDQFALPEGKSERLLSICKALKADEYISGPAAVEYLDVDLFATEKVRVRWMDYSGYSEYPQMYPPFEHGVSIIDMIFNTGPAASHYLKGLGSNQ